jgi:hypothetical protein
MPARFVEGAAKRVLPLWTWPASQFADTPIKAILSAMRQRLSADLSFIQSRNRRIIATQAHVHTHNISNNNAPTLWNVHTDVNASQASRCQRISNVFRPEHSYFQDRDAFQQRDIGPISATACPNTRRTSTTAAMATSDESRLLSLPMELLTRVTNMLNDESLPTLRLTCKTLEGATFDRFTKTFATTYCCVYYKSRWLSLKKFLHGSPRLVRRLGYINFTTNPLERHHYTQMQIAPGEDFDDIHAAQKQFDMREADEDELYEPLDADRQASTPLIHSVLLDLKRLAPFVPIAFDLSNTRFFRDQFLDEGTFLHCDIFLAIASTFCTVSELVLSRRCLDDIDDFTAHLGTRFLSCTSGLHSFTFKSTDFLDEEFGRPLDESKLKFLVNILRSTYYLFSLTLELDEYRLSGDPLDITKTLLFANDLDNLEHLCLQFMEIPEKQLSSVIASCKTTLTIFNIGGIQLVEHDEGWMAIFRSLTTLPKLEFIRLSRLATGDAARAPKLNFENIKHSDEVDKTHLVLDTRREVTAGLQDLLNGPLLYTEEA